MPTRPRPVSPAAPSPGRRARMADAACAEPRASHVVQTERPDPAHRHLLELLERVG